MECKSVQIHEVPFRAAHWWMSRNPSCQSKWTVVKWYGLIFPSRCSFFLFTEENSVIFQTGERERKKGKVHLFVTSTISTIMSTFIFSISHLKSGALPLEGSMNLGKNSSFLGKEKKNDGNYSGRAIKATLCFWSPIIGSVMINMSRLFNLCWRLSGSGATKHPPLLDSSSSISKTWFFLPSVAVIHPPGSGVGDVYIIPA